MTSTTVQAIPAISAFSFEGMLALRTQFEMEVIACGTDDALLAIYGDAAHDLLELRHWRRAAESAIDTVRNLAFESEPMTEVPIFIRSVPQLADAWMEGLAGRRVHIEETWQDAHDPSFEARESMYQS